MQEAAGIAPFVTDVICQQVAGDEDRAVFQHRQIRFAAEQVKFLSLRPGFATIHRAKQQRLLHDLVAITFLLMKRGQQQFAAGQPREAGLVVVGFAKCDPVTWTRLGRQLVSVVNEDFVVYIVGKQRRIQNQNEGRRDRGRRQNRAGLGCLLQELTAIAGWVHESFPRYVAD